MHKIYKTVSMFYVKIKKFISQHTCQHTCCTLYTTTTLCMTQCNEYINKLNVIYLVQLQVQAIIISLLFYSFCEINKNLRSVCNYNLENLKKQLFTSLFSYLEKINLSPLNILRFKYRLLY